MADASSSSAAPASDNRNENVKPEIKQQVLTTGNKWQDFQLAVKRINPWHDLTHIGEIPCARRSLLSGIASGVGVGVIRGLSVGAFAASNWAMGTFLVVSLGTWQICQTSIQREREQVRVVVEEMAQRKQRRAELDKAREPEKT